MLWLGEDETSLLQSFVPIIRMTQKLSFTLALRSSHSFCVIPNPIDILSGNYSGQRSTDEQKTGSWNARLHNNHTQSLHLIYPNVIFLSKFWNTWPLILSPERPGFIWVGNGAIEVYPFVVIGLPIRDVFLQPRVAYRRGIIAITVVASSGCMDITRIDLPRALSWFFNAILSFSS